MNLHPRPPDDLNRTRQGASGRQQDFDRIRELYGILSVVFLAACGALLAAIGFYFWAPLKDPVDVVGVPLLTGYSETMEQASFYAFVLSTILLVLVLRRMSARLPERATLFCGAFGLTILLSMPAWSKSPASLPMATLIGGVAYLVGARLTGVALGLTDGMGRIALSGLTVWILGFPELPVILVSYWSNILFLAVGLGVLGWISLRMAQAVGFATAIRVAAAILVLCGTLTANRRELLLGVMGGAGLVLGLVAGSASGCLRRGVLWPLGRLPWLVFVGLLTGVLYWEEHWSFLGPLDSWRATAGGAGGAAVLATVAPIRLWTGFQSALAPMLSRRSLPWLAVPVMALVGIARPWFAVVLCTAALLILFLKSRYRWNSIAALSLAGLLMLVVLPRGGQSGIDPFHDGHVLSAVWEFETGKRLYDEIFPLWSFSFFATWFTSRLFGLSVSSYLFGAQVFSFLPIGGAFLAALAWTRSLSWGFATALAVAVCPEQSGRFGVHVWFAAAGIAALRANQPNRLVLLAAAACPAALAGYDALGSFMAATVLAILVFGPPGRNLRPTIRSLPKNAVWALVFFIAGVAPFSIGLALWQGTSAATAYWELLVDNARHHSAFVGLPLPWGKAWLRPHMVWPLVIAAVWAGVGAAIIPFASARRLRPWLFLLVHYVILAQRPLGRSDPPHLTGLLYPSILLGSIALFECLRFLNARRPRVVLIDRRVFAFAAAAVACWLSPHGQVTPSEFVRYVREVRSEPSPEPEASRFVSERVREDEFLWDIENGLANYASRRHNPTRQPLTYYICSANEQRVAVEALRQRPPKLIVWQYISGSDDIPNPLRFYVIGQYVYRHYRPAEQGAFLRPVGVNHTADTDLSGFLGPLPLGKLPLRWGEDRVPRLGRRLVSTSQLQPWANSDPLQPEDRTSSPGAAEWETRGSIPSGAVNYLKLDLACYATVAPKNDTATVVLEFAPAGRGYDDQSVISFLAPTDGQLRTYLIPVGCSPGWSWRSTIERLRLRAPENSTLSQPQAELWNVEELAE